MEKIHFLGALCSLLSDFARASISHIHRRGKEEGEEGMRRREKRYESHRHFAQPPAEGRGGGEKPWSERRVRCQSLSFFGGVGAKSRCKLVA